MVEMDDVTKPRDEGTSGAAGSGAEGGDHGDSKIDTEKVQKTEQDAASGDNAGNSNSAPQSPAANQNSPSDSARPEDAAENPGKQDTQVAGEKQNGAPGNNVQKSPASSPSKNKLHVVSVEITPETKSHRLATRKSSHPSDSELDTVEVRVVTKEGIAKQDSIHYIDESLTCPVSPNNEQTSPQQSPKKKSEPLKGAENVKKLNKSSSLDQTDAVSKEKSDVVKENKPVVKDTKVFAKGSKPVTKDVNMNSSLLNEKSSPTERDKLLQGSIKPSKVVVVEDMSNVNDKMPITKV